MEGMTLRAHITSEGIDDRREQYVVEASFNTRRDMLDAATMLNRAHGKYIIDMDLRSVDTQWMKGEHLMELLIMQRPLQQELIDNVESVITGKVTNRVGQ